jgi:endonuclease/exonuclease/phosphatase family metal-dependent hydrolase
MIGKGRNLIGGLAILLVPMLLLGPLHAAAKSEELTVMTRNLYLGAELAPAMTAGNADEFLGAVYEILGVIEYNNFRERAEALAAEIVEKKPLLVGLQEVYNFTIDGTNPEPPFSDYLAELLDALDAQGASYRVAATVRNLDLQFPFGANVIGVTDRDVILARSDLTTAVIDLGGVCRTSADGCNYSVFASIPNPLGSEEAPLPPIAIERGFAAVTAGWGDGNAIVFVNTHLEVRDVGPTGLVQAAQAYELSRVLAALNATGMPIVVVGDFNSDPRDPVRLSETYGPIVPPYLQLQAAGYRDAWLLHRPDNPDGFTCCQDENLINRRSALYERVDLIFASEEPRKVKVEVIGNKNSDKTSSGLWPSDHAGVAASIQF